MLQILTKSCSLETLDLSWYCSESLLSALEANKSLKNLTIRYSVMMKERLYVPFTLLAEICKNKPLGFKLIITGDMITVQSHELV